MNYMYEMTGEINETPWEDYGVKVPQIAWQEDRKEEEKEMESPILPSKSEPTNVYDPNDVHRLHRRHSMLQSAKADSHLSLSMSLPDGYELRFLATDKLMPFDWVMEKYWRLFSDGRFSETMYNEMKVAGWKIFSSYYWLWSQFLEARKNYLKQIKKAKLEAAENAKLKEDKVALQQ